ncbi:MAG: PEGA domain-containing protein [Methanolinea sp.]|nr:PEGA domain-containing protein [Methanolinea sp.]
MKPYSLVVCTVCILVLAMGCCAQLTASTHPTSRGTGTPTPVETGIPIGGDEGYFSIDSSPGGADVTFDGVFQGETPLVVSVYTTGTPYHTITVYKYGYKTWTRTYHQNPSARGTIYVSAQLEPDVQTGYIHVTSSPSGAVARLDGGNTITTPGTFSNIPAGRHTIEVSKSGYYPYSTSITVSAGGTSSVNAALSPQQTTGSLRVASSPSGAEVFVDEIYRGYSPLSIGALSSGSHTVRLHLSGYQDYSMRASVSSGSETVVSASLVPVLQPSTGNILVSSVPDGASIYLDGNYRGITLKGNAFDIPGVTPGIHTVALQKDGYQDYSTTVGTSAGGTSTVSAVLNPGSTPATTGSITVQSSPSGADVYVDNLYKGITPLTVTDVATGSRVVTLELSGYLKGQYTIQVNAGQSVQVFGTLTPLPVTQSAPLSVPVVASALLAATALVLRRRR